MKPTIAAILFLVCTLSVTGCPTGSDFSKYRQDPEPDMSGPSGSSPDGTFTITGTVAYVSLEGGFFAIHAEDGRTYKPVNLPHNFKHNGLPITATARVKTDAMGIHMVGPIIEIVDIAAR